MVVLEVNYNDYFLLLQQFADAFRIPHDITEDYLVVPESKGSGSMKVLKLFNELQVLVMDVSFNEGLNYKRIKSTENFFILHFDHVFIADTFKVRVDDEVLQKTNTYHSFVRLTSTSFDNEEFIPPRQQLKSVLVLFNEKWLKKYIGLSPNSDVLKKYLSLKTESFDIEPLDDEYMKLLNDLWSVPKNDPFKNIFLQNRVTLLIERFFTRLHEKTSLVNGMLNLSEDEVQRLVVVEQKLVSDFHATPPTIEAFSKMVSMSSTKLKKSFKEMYGNSIYSYYQHSRMEKAKELLESGKLSVKEVAEAVGYINTSNFVTAFKKQYNMLPAEVYEK